MCDHGRQGAAYNHKGRLVSPQIKGETSKLVPARAQAMRLLKQSEAEEVAFVVSPQLSAENMVALFALAEGLGIKKFYESGRPDDAFALRNDPEKFSDDFLICADKNPNRAGLRHLAKAGGLKLKSFADLQSDMDAGGVKLVVFMGGAVPLSGADKVAFVAALNEVESIVFSTHKSPLTELASVALPLASHLEQEGSFVNIDGLRQSFKAAIGEVGMSQALWLWLKQFAKVLGIDWPFEDFQTLEALTTEHLISLNESPQPGEQQG